MKHMRLVILLGSCVALLASKMSAQSTYVPLRDWRQNASAIIDLYEGNRDEKKFAHEFLLYNAKIFILWSEENDRNEDRKGHPVDPSKEIGLAIIQYLNAKLYCQFVKDHPDELGSELESARDAAIKTGDLFRRYHIEVIREDIAAFKSAFGNYKALSLRSMDRL